jgi:hypothetical protein
MSVRLFTASLSYQVRMALHHRRGARMEKIREKHRQSKTKLDRLRAELASFGIRAGQPAQSIAAHGIKSEEKLGIPK